MLLKTGDVLLVGGTAITERNPVLTAELYHPSTGTFTLIGATHLSDATQIVPLNDGRALVVGNSGNRSVRPVYKAFHGQPGQ